ncbi:MAG: MgtC/SapB family protein [Chthoniobacteraceae bacterium]
MNWLLGNLHSLLPTPWANALLALAAIACGSIIGAERERREKPAGLRTMILVCLGSAVFTMVSVAFASNTGDSGRVAAQIVTGIGFLGAGVIMRDRGTISGMTTAATIWVCASVGMVVGAGFAGAGLALSILVRMVLVGILLVEAYGLGKISHVVATVTYDSDLGKTRIRLTQILSLFNVPLQGIRWHEEKGESWVELDLRLHQHRLFDVLDQIVRDPAVQSVKKADHSGSAT